MVSKKLSAFLNTQANNAYIFPGFGLGLVISGAIRVHDDMLLAAGKHLRDVKLVKKKLSALLFINIMMCFFCVIAEALAGQVSEENYEKGMIYPSFSAIRKISAHIAANAATKAYELGLAGRLPRPKDIVKCAESSMYSPTYRLYR